MQKIIHKLIRYRRGGVNVVADINAAISAGEGGVSYSSVHSRTRVVQRNGQTWTESDTGEPTTTDESDKAGTDGNG